MKEGKNEGRNEGWRKKRSKEKGMLEESGRKEVTKKGGRKE